MICGPTPMRGAAAGVSSVDPSTRRMRRWSRGRGRLLSVKRKPVSALPVSDARRRRGGGWWSAEWRVLGAPSLGGVRVGAGGLERRLLGLVVGLSVMVSVAWVERARLGLKDADNRLSGRPSCGPVMGVGRRQPSHRAAGLDGVWVEIRRPEKLSATSVCRGPILSAACEVRRCIFRKVGSRKSATVGCASGHQAPATTPVQSHKSRATFPEPQIVGSAAPCHISRATNRWVQPRPGHTSRATNRWASRAPEPSALGQSRPRPTCPTWPTIYGSWHCGPTPLALARAISTGSELQP